MKTTTKLAINLKAGDKIAIPADPVSGPARTYVVESVGTDPDDFGRTPVSIIVVETGVRTSVWYFDDQTLAVVTEQKRTGARIPFQSIGWISEYSSKDSVVFNTEEEAREIAHGVMQAYARQWPEDPDVLVHVNGGRGKWGIEIWDGENEYHEPTGTVRVLSRYNLESV